MTDRTYPLFPIVTFLGFFLPLIPLPWHLQAMNSGTTFFILWSSLACLNQFVNSIVWAGNALNSAPIWCEISIRITMAASVGIPASSLCINRRLYQIANIKAPMSLAQKRRSVLIDSLICLLFPLLFVALQYIVQGHRFNIFEDAGCFPALYNTLPTFFISNMWPLAIGLISAVYCVMTLRLFARRRAEFTRIISSNTTLTINRYFRLMALSMAEICATTPLSVFTIWVNATANPVGPWRSWADTHFDYSRIEQVPAVLWRSDRVLAIGIEFTCWVAPVCSFVFFAFFGFASESRKNYRLAWTWMQKALGFSINRSGTKLQRSYPQISKGLENCRMSPNSGTFSIPLPDLKRGISTNSTLSLAKSDKYFNADSYPPTPQSLTTRIGPRSRSLSI